MRRATRHFGRRLASIAGCVCLIALFACERMRGPDESPLEAGSQRIIAAGGSRSFVSFSHSCAVIDAGVQCWGANGNGQLGDGFVARRAPIPASVRSLDRGVTAIAAGGAHTCAIQSGTVLCWGRNDRHQVAAAPSAMLPEPTAISGLPEPVTGIAAGDEHTCAIARDQLYCWGRGTDGELGQPVKERCGGRRVVEFCSATPLQVPLAGRITQVALGRNHGCAIADGQVHCWGRNARGQLGSGPGRNPVSQHPVRVVHEGVATAISAGDDHTCALIDGAVACWGANEAGQLGDGSREDRDRPVAAVGLASKASDVSAGGSHSCAIAGVRTFCWGANDHGQLGVHGEGRDVPGAIELSVPAIRLASGADHSCAAHRSGAVSCWGANDFGQLGNGQPARTAPPVSVAPWDRGRIRDRNDDGRITIVCLGDSNTEVGFRFDTTWCERLEAQLNQGAPRAERDRTHFETKNRGWSGATAVSSSPRRAEDQLTYALEFDAPDAVILAYGTNDLTQHAEPETIISAVLRHLLLAREFGVDTFVALVPPSRNPSPEFEAGVESVNALIRRAVRADRVIDFATPLSAADYLDNVHVNEAGHAKWASAAAGAIWPAP